MEKKSIGFWIKKMYLLNQIPLNENQIKKGLSDVDIWLCSTGGAGSNLLKDYIDQYIKVKSPYLAALLTHHHAPVNFDKKEFKAIYLHADPFSVLRSVKRRGLVGRNIMKLNNAKNLGSEDTRLLESVFDQFENWTQTKVNYPVLCLKYESLYESLDILSNFLNIPFHNFPVKRERLSEDIEVDRSLVTQYMDRYQAWKDFPNTMILS